VVQVLLIVQPALQGGRVHQQVTQTAIFHALQARIPQDCKETVPSVPVAIIVQIQGGWSLIVTVGWGTFQLMHHIFVSFAICTFMH